MGGWMGGWMEGQAPPSPPASSSLSPPLLPLIIQARTADAPSRIFSICAGVISSSRYGSPGVWMHVRVFVSRSTMMYVKGDLSDVTSTLDVSMLSVANSLRMASPAASVPILETTRTVEPDVEAPDSSRAAAVSALPQLPPPCVSSSSVRILSSGFGNEATDARKSIPTEPIPTSVTEDAQGTVWEDRRRVTQASRAPRASPGAKQ